MGAAAVRAGSAFVEIGADPRKLFAALNKINKQIGSLGSSMSAAGRKVMGAGMAVAAPFGAAVAAGTRFQDVMLAMRASTGATADQVSAVKQAALAMSQALGIGPTEAAQGFLELLKAGMSVEQVLGGAGEAALAFAKVGGLAVSDAAVVMADAMKVFGVTGDVAANTLSAAADSSSTSIEGIALAFSQVSAVAGLANQSIQDTAAAIAIMANAGIKGSDAGTSLKTMLMRLMAPADDAVGALQQLKLNVDSFRNADGTMLPMVEIIRTLTTAMQGMDQAAKDDIFRRIFGQDAIRAAAVMTAAGVEGFQAMRDSMAGAATVGDKFAMMQSGISGSVNTLLAALERLAIAITDAVGPAFQSVVTSMTPLIDGFTKFVSANQEMVGQLAKSAVAVAGVGAVMVAAGGSISLFSWSLGGLATAASATAAPFRLMVSAASGVGSAFAAAGPSVLQFGLSTGRSMAAAGSAVGSFATSATRSLVVFGGSLGSVFASQFRIARFIGQSFGGSLLTAFGKMAMSIGGVRSAVAALAPAVGFAAKAFGALASDALRVVGPISQPFIQAAGSVFSFATATATGVASYVSSLAAAVGATVAANARIAGAWVGNGLAAVGTFATGVATSIAAYISSIVAAVSVSIASAAGIAGAWIATAMPATSAFVASAVGSIATYIASTVAALAASVTSAAGVAAAWITSGMPGLVAFVGTAVAGIATYVGACGVAVASSVASAAAVAAAWLAPLAPLLAIGAAVGGAALLAYQFGGAITSALGGIAELAGQAGGAIGSAFGSVISDAITVFGDLYSTAQTTFGGIYAAIADGDMAGAMDILWAGLYAGWLRGVEALMGSADSFVAFLQNTFTYMWAGVKGVFGDSINWVLNAFDDMVAAVQKSWNYVQSFIKKGFDLEAENKKVTDANAARKREREAARGMGKEMAAADKVAADRLATNEQRAAERRKATEAATGTLDNKAKAAKERRTMNDQYAQLLKDIEAATTIEQLQNAYGEFDALSSNGRLTDTQAATLEVALEDAQERISKADVAASAEGAANVAAAGPSAGDVAAGAGAAGADAAQSRGDSAGTFSAAAAGAMGVGSSIPQKQLQALEKIEKNTRENANGGVVQE